MKAWEWIWFQNLIAWLRKFQWFEKYAWGNSISLEDFVRNPFDVFFRTFCFKNVKPLSLINFRIYYVTGNNWTGFNLNVLSPWVTKFSNAWLWFQISLCLKGWLPIPCVMIHFRPTYHIYFQGALGIAPQDYPDRFDGVMYAKLRIVNDKTSNELIWNPTDQKGWNEGGI